MSIQLLVEGSSPTCASSNQNKSQRLLQQGALLAKHVSGPSMGREFRNYSSLNEKQGQLPRSRHSHRRAPLSVWDVPPAMHGCLRSGVLACRCIHVLGSRLLGELLAGVLINDPWAPVFGGAVRGDKYLHVVVLGLQSDNFLRN
jgi:hypothetical protein